MSKDFDFEQFTTALRSAIVHELQSRREELRDFEVDALAVDCHPWHGILDLAVRISEDEGDRWEMGEWELYPFTDSEGAEGSWAAATSGLRSSMRACWQLGVNESEDAAAEVAKRFFQACAAALTAAEVRVELQTLRLTPGFELFVGDPDGSTPGNFCGPRSH